MNKFKAVNTKLSKIFTIPLIEDEGVLCFAEENNHIPFKFRRFYYILNVKRHAERGFHAHKKTQQVLFCLKGSISVVLDNGNEREVVVLNDPNQGIFLDKMMWHEMKDFTKDTVLLVAASENYKEKDYIRDYNTFLTRARYGQLQFSLVKTAANVIYFLTKKMFNINYMFKFRKA